MLCKIMEHTILIKIKDAIPNAKPMIDNLPAKEEKLDLSDELK